MTFRAFAGTRTHRQIRCLSIAMITLRLVSRLALDRTYVFAGVALFAVYSFVAGASADALTPDVSRPHIVLIMADDLGWGDVGYAQDRAPDDTYTGHPILQTPRLDEIAATGLVFNRYYAASPVCSPTRASLLTGRHGARHRIHDFLGLNDEGKLKNRDLLISEVARTQGYVTGHFGKWHLGSVTKHVYDMRLGRIGNAFHYSPPWEHGYQTVFASENWMPTFDPYDRFPVRRAEQAAYFTGPSDVGLTHRIPNDSRVDGRDESEIVGDQAVAFIENEAGGDAPFFVTVFFSTPHLPLEETPSTRYDGLGLSTNQRRYFESITAMDRQIGRIRDKLVELGIADDTLLIVTSDNGPQDLNFGSTGGLRGRKSSLYEGGIRVPMVMQWTGTIAPGSTNALAVSSDMLPTLVDLWGIEFPDARPLDGRSLRHVMNGTALERAADYRFFSQYRSHLIAMDNQYKLISTDDGSSYTLYDLLADPYEANPVTATDRLDATPTAIQNRFNDLLTRLGAWQADVLTSELGADYETGIASTVNAAIRADAEMSLPLRQIGTDEFGAEIYEDRYQIIPGSPAYEASGVVSVFIEKQYVTLAADLRSMPMARPRVTIQIQARRAR